MTVVIGQFSLWQSLWTLLSYGSRDRSHGPYTGIKALFWKQGHFIYSALSSQWEWQWPLWYLRGLVHHVYSNKNHHPSFQVSAGKQSLHKITAPASAWLPLSQCPRGGFLPFRYRAQRWLQRLLSSCSWSSCLCPLLNKFFASPTSHMLPGKLHPQSRQLRAPWFVAGLSTLWLACI